MTPAYQGGALTQLSYRPINCEIPLPQGAHYAWENETDREDGKEGDSNP